MKRRIYNLDAVLHLVDGVLIDHLGLYLSDVFVVDLRSDNLIFSGLYSLLHGGGLHCGQILNRQNLLRNSLVMRRRKLSAVLPVYLVSVVLRRVVAGSDIDAGDAAQLADCK